MKDQTGKKIQIFFLVILKIFLFWNIRFPVTFLSSTMRNPDSRIAEKSGFCLQGTVEKRAGANPLSNI